MTGEDEGDGKELAHVQGHRLLEFDLRFLDEFDEEPGAEAAQQEETEEEAAVDLVQFVLVDPDHDQAQQQVGKCLVELRGMLGFRLAAQVEDEAPGEGRDVSVDLGIEEVAQADHAAREGDGDAEPVHDPEEVEVILLAVMIGEPPHREEQGDGAAVAGEAALPGHENLPEPRPGAEIIIHAVAEAGAHDRGDQQGEEQRVHDLGVHLLAGEEPFEEIPADDESRHEQQAVPADLERSDLEKDGVDVPVHG